MNTRLELLRPYPFARLEKLIGNAEINPDLDFISLAIGEPKHSCPKSAVKALSGSLSELQKYPATAGKIDLRQAAADWANRRFQLDHNRISAETQLLPVNGTREALFAIGQVIADPKKTGGTFGMPNPFYQIYEGAALLAGKTPLYFNNVDSANMQPQWDQIAESDWRSMELLYICSPGNPSGTYISLDEMCNLIELADSYDFTIVSDECYSELYLDEQAKAPSILEACKKMGRTDFARCIAVHSLSKRSNLPGLRSGFVAGDENILSKFLLYRTYHGSAMSGTVQAASIAAWEDENHAETNRQEYRRKYREILPKLRPHFDFIEPEAAFYLWLNTPIDDQEFCLRLFRDFSLKVVPGSLLARDTPQGNPGKNRIRIALVASFDECSEGIDRLIQCGSQFS